MITLTQLEYVVAVDNFRHFAQAADHCFITQPTLSMQIKKLEDALDIKIFDRSKQPVIPTDIGQQFIEQARLVLAEAGRLNELVKHFQSDISGDLRIGIIPTLAPYLLPLFAGKFKRKYPQVRLRFEEMITESIVSKLRTDQLDAGIFVTPFRDPAIIEVPVFYEEMLIYAHPGHPLLNQASVSVKDAAKPDLWLLSDGHCFRNQVVNLCSVADTSTHDLPFDLQGSSLETLIRMIDREGGFTLVPELAVLEMPHAQQQNTAHFADIKPMREVSVCYARNYVKRRLNQLLVDEIVDGVPAALRNPQRGELVTWK